MLLQYIAINYENKAFMRNLNEVIFLDVSVSSNLVHQVRNKYIYIVFLKLSTNFAFLDHFQVTINNNKVATFFQLFVRSHKKIVFQHFFLLAKFIYYLLIVRNVSVK